MAWVAGACAAPLLSCAEKKAPAPLVVPDSGPTCERGTLNCACANGRCDTSLLCVAGLCLASGAQPDPPEPPFMRPPVIRPPPASDGGKQVTDAAPDAPLDASGAPDAASVPGGDVLDASQG